MSLRTLKVTLIDMQATADAMKRTLVDALREAERYEQLSDPTALHKAARSLSDLTTYANDLLENLKTAVRTVREIIA
jgi:hypothetical protein